MSARLTSEFWISAYRVRLSQASIPVFVVKKGDATAGGILVKVNTLDGCAICYQRSFSLVTGERCWETLAKGGEAEVDAQIAVQCGFDPDLWVLEIEDRQGRHFLD